MPSFQAGAQGQEIAATQLPASMLSSHLSVPAHESQTWVAGICRAPATSQRRPGPADPAASVTQAGSGGGHLPAACPCSQVGAPLGLRYSEMSSVVPHTDSSGWGCQRCHWHGTVREHRKIAADLGLECSKGGWKQPVSTRKKQSHSGHVEIPSRNSRNLLFSQVNSCRALAFFLILNKPMSDVLCLTPTSRSSL